MTLRSVRERRHVFGDRTLPTETDARSESDRDGRIAALLLAGVAVALALLIFETRRNDGATLEPPF